jgi:YHS domain-containing protein
MTGHHEDFTFPETVCQRTLSGDLNYYPKTEYHGQTIYFCTEYCLRAFLADPERFYPAHSKRHADPKKCEYNAEKPGG